ncbi:hypothetical protein [Limnospira indica]|uniref:hypothetical protein n=1 Tax=Limnospira indica TaxID=147322 RepID=UPI0001E2ABE6
MDKQLPRKQLPRKQLPSFRPLTGELVGLDIPLGLKVPLWGSFFGFPSPDGGIGRVGPCLMDPLPFMPNGESFRPLTGELVGLDIDGEFIENLIMRVVVSVP